MASQTTEPRTMHAGEINEDGSVKTSGEHERSTARKPVVRDAGGKPTGKPVVTLETAGDGDIIRVDPDGIDRLAVRFKNEAVKVGKAHQIVRSLTDSARIEPGYFVEADTVRKVFGEFCTAYGNNLGAIVSALNNLSTALHEVAKLLRTTNKNLKQANLDGADHQGRITKALATANKQLGGVGALTVFSDDGTGKPAENADKYHSDDASDSAAGWGEKGRMPEPDDEDDEDDEDDYGGGMS